MIWIETESMKPALMTLGEKGEISIHEGISMNQYCLYLLSKNSSTTVGSREM